MNIFIEPKPLIRPAGTKPVWRCSLRVGGQFYNFEYVGELDSDEDVKKAVIEKYNDMKIQGAYVEFKEFKVCGI